jgi:hypothetical protein
MNACRLLEHRDIYIMVYKIDKIILVVSLIDKGIANRAHYLCTPEAR